MRTGLFITLEGLDGCGKSTQARFLKEYLIGHGYQTVLTREPGGTPLAEAMRSLILTPTEEELDPMAEALLYAAARAQHVNGLIRPALAAGQIVISERFVDSSLAYQGFGLGRDLELIREINRLALGDFGPDLTFLLDVQVEQGSFRVNHRSHSAKIKPDRIESRGAEFYERVRRGYLELARLEPQRITLIEAELTIEQVQTEIIPRVMARLNPGKAAN
jgi:dTMP kinase